MNAHLVLPVLETQLPQGTPPPREPRPIEALPAADPGSPVAGPTVDPGETDGAASTAWGLSDTGPATGELPGVASGAQTAAATHQLDGAELGAGMPTAATPAAAGAYDGLTATAHSVRGVGSVDPAWGAGAALGAAAGASYEGVAATGDLARGVGSTGSGLGVGAAVGAAYGIAGAAGAGRAVFAGGQPVASAASAGRVELGRSAAVGAPRRTGPSRPRSGGGGRVARWFGVPQIVCWQLAMIVAGLGLRESTAIKIVAGVTALLLLTGVTVRWGGQWLYQWIGHGVRFGLRRRSLRAATTGEETVVPVLLAKDTWTCSVQLDPDAAGPAEATTDAVADAGGLSAALWLPEGTRIDALPSARDLLDVMEKQPVTMAAQTVLHTGTRPDEPARTWIAVRALRSADLADDADLEAVLANGLRRVSRRLDRLQIEAEPLAGQGFGDTLAALAHVSGGRDVLTEGWAACRTGPVIQVTYRLAGFGQLPQAAAGMFLGHALHRPERVATTVAVTAWRAPGAATRAATVLRIAAVNRSALDQAARDISRLAAEFGVRPERLDGRHRAGVLASLPLGHTTPGGYLS